MKEKSRKAVRMPSILMVLSLFGTVVEAMIAKITNGEIMKDKGIKKTYRIASVISLLVAILFGAQASVALGATTSVTETDQFNYQHTYMLNMDGFSFKEKAALYYIQKYAVKEKVSPALVMAIVKKESKFNSFDVRDGGLSIGYMHLHWDTAYAAGYRSIRGDSKIYAKEDWPTDGINPDTNIKYGIGYLKMVYSEYKDSLIYKDPLKNTLSAYNLGLALDPDKSNEESYVIPVLGYYGSYASKYYSGIETGWPAETPNVRKHPWDGFMDFEGGTNGAVIRSTIPGLQFTTTKGLDWLYGDKQYYNVYPRGPYEVNGKFFAWLGVSGDEGRIDFTKGTAAYLSVLVSAESGLMIEAFDSEDNLLITSGLAGSNAGTRTFTRLTVEAPGMAYVKIHDSGNYWLIDDLATDAMGVPSPHYQAAEFAKLVVGKEYLQKLGDQTTKGWVAGKFVSPDEIKHLDCSGLIFWSYNKVYGATKYVDSLNSVLYEGAGGQHDNNFGIFTNKADLLPGDALFFDFPGGKPIDHVVMYVGNYEYSGTIKGTEYNGTYDVVNARHPDLGIIPDTVERLTSAGGFVGYGRLIEPKVGMFALSHSPVDLIMIDPDGNRITKGIWEIPGILYYSEWDVDNNGDRNDAITVPELKKGDYLISAIPESGALPTDTFTLEVLANGETFILAQNVQIRDIPSKPYIVRVTDDDVEPLLDNIPPNTTAAFSGAHGNNDWYISDIEVNLTAEDNEGGTGVNFTEYSFDNATWNTYIVPFRIISEGITTVFYRSADNADNIESTKNQTVNIDKTPPAITVNSPINTSYILNQTVIAKWTANDSISGIASVTATVPNGTAINTAMIGSKNFSVNAADNAGNQANKIVDYNIVYNYSGVLPSIKDSKGAFKLGSTISVKFQLTDFNGNNIFTAIAGIYLANIVDGIIDKETNGTSSGKANTDNLFRYDVANNQYIFNLATKPLTKGNWQIRIELDDGTSKYAVIELK